MFQYFIFWKKSPIFDKSPPLTEGGVRIAVLVPARHEATKIVACLDSIIRNDYPRSLYQVCIIDDHSDDDTVAIATNWIKKNALEANFQVIKNFSTGKKSAIETGIRHVDCDLVMTTDADCIVPSRWLSLFAALFSEKNAKFIAAPVEFFEEPTAFGQFQTLDFLGMMGITAAGIHGGFLRMCNGANLAYPRTVFHEVDGFKNINHVASGDDMLLMQKIAKYYPNDIYFLKNTEASVFTYAKGDFKTFVSQRIRWASKSSSYTEQFTTLQLAIPYIFCINIFHTFVLSVFGFSFLKLMCIQLFAKTITDFCFLNDVSTFFRRQYLMKLNSFLISQIYHILYICLVGTISVFQPKYEWKGRKVR